MIPPSLMLVDGNARASLAVVRSLGRRGIPVYTGGPDRVAAAAASRYAVRAFVHPPGEAGVEATHRVIIEHVRAWRPAVLLPIFTHGWATVLAFYDEYAALAAVVPSPGRELFHALYDKTGLAELAARYGMPVPATFRFGTQAEALAAADSLPYPLLLKPRASVSGLGIHRADSPRELAALLPRYAAPPILQEYVEGEDLELTILCDRGEPLAVSAYVGLRHYPLPYGPPIAARTVRDDALVALGVTFLRRLGYHGIAHLDLRRDRRDRQPKLLDFNPRLAGTTEISIRSGVDFPFLLYRMALGQAVEPCSSYDVGLEFRWLLYGELLHLARTRERRRALRGLRPRRGVATNVSLTDPRPHLAEGLAVIRRGLRVAGRKPRAA